MNCSNTSDYIKNNGCLNATELVRKRVTRCKLSKFNLFSLDVPVAPSTIYERQMIPGAQVWHIYTHKQACKVLRNFLIDW